MASVWVVIEAVERWQDPPDVKGGWMLGVAIFGLLVNLVAAAVLSGGHTHNENTRAALAHVASDAAGSIAAMIAAGLVLGFGWRRADPLISIVLAVMIFWGAWRLVVQTVDVLMEGTPGDIVTKLNQAIVRAMADPAVRQRLADLGQEIYPPELQTPEALAEFQKTELHKWGPIITAANIRVE
jgi:cobalt-zinc-cadmium efflux system protein